MQASDCAPLVEVTRGSIVESIHFGAFVVVDSKGSVVVSQGKPEPVDLSAQFDEAFPGLTLHRARRS